MKSISILCNYRLDPNRVGGMDYFFWAFDHACKQAGHQLTWFFPNKAIHGAYKELNIKASESESIEKFFLQTVEKGNIQCDTIFTHFLELCTPFYKQAKKITGARIIAVDHNPRPREGYSFKVRVKKMIYGCVYSRFTDYFISVSEQSVHDFKKDFKCFKSAKSRIITNGLPVERIRVKSATSKHTPINFMVSSHLRPEKGLKDLLLAFQALPKHIKQKARIDIYGDGPEKVALNEMIDSHELAMYIRLMGSTACIHDKYAEYDYLIHPSHAETFCYAVVESLLANVPVITTKGAGNILGLVSHEKNGFLFSIGDIQALCEIMQQIIVDQRKMSINTRKEIEETFSTASMVQNYMSLI